MRLSTLSYVFQHPLNYNWKINAYRLIKEKDFYTLHASVVLRAEFCSRDLLLLVVYKTSKKRTLCRIVMPVPR